MILARVKLEFYNFVFLIIRFCKQLMIENVGSVGFKITFILLFRFTNQGLHA